MQPNSNVGKQVYVDTASGALASRAEREQARRSANPAGDQLMVTKLDRPGPSWSTCRQITGLGERTIRTALTRAHQAEAAATTGTGTTAIVPRPEAP